MGKKNKQNKVEQKEDVQCYDERGSPLQDQKQFSKYKTKEQQLMKLEKCDQQLLIKKNGSKAEFKEITMDYYIDHGYKLLLLTREKNLTGMQKLRLRQIMTEFDPHGFMSEAWIRKEMFVDALDDLDIEEIRRVRDECLQSKHYRIQAFGRTLKKRDRQLESYCKNSTDNFKFTNAFTEGTNNQCKIVKRVSMGFRYKDNYSKKLHCKFHPLRGWIKT